MTQPDRPETAERTSEPAEASATSDRKDRSTQILISDRQTGLPYSKGLMASQVMVTGLSPYRAYQVA
jgi:hypothetical protein